MGCRMRSGPCVRAGVVADLLSFTIVITIRRAPGRRQARISRDRIGAHERPHRAAAWADRLGEARPEAGLDQRVDQAQRGGRPAAVLAGGSEVQVAHTAAGERPLRAHRGGRERTREDRERDQRERGEKDEREAAVPPCHARGRRRRGPGALASSTPSRALPAAAAHPRGVVFRSTSAIASLRRVMVSGSTASGSRYGPSRSSTSLTRPRKTLASATKNCGSLL